MAENHSTEPAGLKLKRAREQLRLRVRDVELASQRISEKHNNEEFTVLINRISEIENRGLIPTIYKLYSLCAIYRLSFEEVMGWFGIALASMPADSAFAEVQATHAVGFAGTTHGSVQVPVALDPGFDLKKTVFLSRLIQRWGTLPLLYLDALEGRRHRYAFIGTEDWFMYPILQPGSLVIVDEKRSKIAAEGWSNEFDRPIYLLEHREGYLCGWCSLQGSQLILQPHPLSPSVPRVFEFPNEIEVVGQVVGVAMRLDQGRRRRTRS